MRSSLVALLTVVSAIAVGCSGSDGKSEAGHAGARTAHDGRTNRPKAPTDGTAVIRSWVDALRAGKVDRATGFFGVPVAVENGGPVLRLRSRAAVRAFNDSLPCGARLLRTRRRGRYTIGVFRLTDRPGGSCGNGAGGTAATAFRFRNGKIVEWIRVPVPERGSPRPVTPPPQTQTS